MTGPRSRYDAELDRAAADVDPYDPRVACRPPRRRPSRRRPGTADAIAGLIFLAIAIVGSIVYMVFVISVRDSSQIPLMASGAVVLAIVFGGARGLQPAGGLARRPRDGRAGGRCSSRSWAASRRSPLPGSPPGAIILFQIGSWSPADPGLQGTLC